MKSENLTIDSSHSSGKILSNVLLLILLLVFTPYALAKPELTASIDRSNIIFGETISYSLKLTGQQQNFPEPDLSPLLKDFSIVGVQQGSQLINKSGEITSLQEWVLDLSPKRQGKLTIPSVTVEGLRSQALSINVMPPSAKSVDGKLRDVFIETSVSNQQPYVQSQITYTVKVFYAVNLLRATLSEPSADGALAYNLGNNIKYTVERNNRQYQVLERRYAIFPQKSGALTIEPPHLNAAMTNEPRRANAVQQFFGAGGKPIRVTTADTRLNVKPKPADFKGTWLPAKKLQLKETWSDPNPTFRVGQPTTRTISIQAEGLTGEQLPTLTLANIPNINTYPDNSEINSSAVDEKIIGIRKQKIAYVPTKAGNIELPAINVNWWNTTTQKMETATLATKTIKVLPGNPATTTNNITTNPTPDTKTNSSNNDTTTLTSNTTEKNYWPWISVALLLLWLITIISWWLSRKRQPVMKKVPSITKETHNNLTEKSLRKKIQQACETNDLRSLKKYILDWGNSVFPETTIRELGELKAKINDSSLENALSELDAALYRNNNTQWDASHFWEIFSKYQPEKPDIASEKQEKLPGLYL